MKEVIATPTPRPCFPNITSKTRMKDSGVWVWGYSRDGLKNYKMILEHLDVPEKSKLSQGMSKGCKHY